jgi:hypothetical protein
MFPFFISPGPPGVRGNEEANRLAVSALLYNRRDYIRALWDRARRESGDIENV